MLHKDVDEDLHARVQVRVLHLRGRAGEGPGKVRGRFREGSGTVPSRGEVRVMHRLDGVVRRRLGGAPHVVARVHLAPAARSQLVEGEVEGVEERVVQKDAERELGDDPAPRRHAGAVREHVGGRRPVPTSGRVSGHLRARLAPGDVRRRRSRTAAGRG